MKKGVLIMLSAALLSSCAGSDLLDPTPNDGQVDIALTSIHKSVEVETRKPYIEEISTANPLAARVLSATASGKYSGATLHHNGKMVFTGPGKVAAYDRTGVDVDKTKFPIGSGDEAPLFLCGLYPYDGWEVSTTDGETAVFPITGNLDVMAAAEVSGTPKEAKEGRYPSLAFNHLLAKFNITLKSYNAASPAIWGNVKSIKLLKVAGETPNSQVVVNLNTATATFKGSESAPSIYAINVVDGEPVYTDNELAAGIPLPETTALVGYTMIEAFESGKATDLVFEVETDYVAKQEVKVQLPYTGMNNGRAFGITFTFKADSGAITSTATVNPWVSGGNKEVELN